MSANVPDPEENYALWSITIPHYRADWGGPGKQLLYLVFTYRLSGKMFKVRKQKQPGDRPVVWTPVGTF